MSSTTYSSSHNPPHIQNHASPPLTIILTVTLLVFFFAGFFSVYFFRCFMENIANTWQLWQGPSGNLAGESTSPANPGLDPSLIQAFPTFTYSTVQDFQREKYGHECAICLAEFEDENILRLLTVCSHGFHHECIDSWLQSHKTCPVCRCDLNSPGNSLDKSPAPHRRNSVNNVMTGSNVSQLEDAISIFIKEDEEDRDREESGEPAVNGNVIKQNGRYGKTEKFPRSHSTGHSIPRTKIEAEAEDRRRHTFNTSA